MNVAKDMLALTPFAILMVLAILGIQDYIGVKFTVAGIGFILWLAWAANHWTRRLKI